MTQQNLDTRRPYAKPEIVQEMDLETRAGSDCGGVPCEPNPINLFPGESGN